MAHTDDEIEEKFNLIIDKISNDKMSLFAALKDVRPLSSKTFYDWLDADDEKIKRYARACEERADNIFEEVLEIADDSSGDVRTDIDGNESFNQEFAARSRIKIDARKWMLGKMNPKKYGDKLDIETKSSVTISFKD